MILGLLGRKLGMLQVFDDQGRMRSATVIEAGPCLITQLKTDERDGYSAAQIGFGARKHTNKPMRGHLQRQVDLRYLREFKVDNPSDHKVGERVGVELFQKGDSVDVTGTSKGRGFAGVVKRHHFAGGPKTHGQSDRHRAPGSVGAGGYSRTFKGMRMGGHMGDEQVTVLNLEVIESDPARGLLIVAGSVPGARLSLLKIRYSSRTLEPARARKPAEVVDANSEAENEEASDSDESADDETETTEASHGEETSAAAESDAKEGSS